MTERDNKTNEDWFQRLKKGLDKSTNKISSAISNAFLKQKIDDDIVEPAIHWTEIIHTFASFDNNYSKSAVVNVSIEDNDFASIILQGTRNNSGSTINEHIFENKNKRFQIFWGPPGASFGKPWGTFSDHFASRDAQGDLGLICWW